MKWMMINAYQIGLVFKKGAYKRMLKEGVYWLWDEDVMIYDTAKQFIAPVELNILLQDIEIAAALHVVEVKDSEIVLQYENGLLKQVLTAGRYTFWKGIVQYDFVRADISKIEITENIGRATLQHKLLAPYVRSYTVESFEKALLFVDGNYVQTLNSGVYFWWKNNIAINIGKADTRMQQIEINGQEILTKDKAALRINGQAQYKVVDIEKALLQNKEYDKQLYVLMQLALREFVGALTLDELLVKKNNVGKEILENLGEKAEDLGLKVSDAGIRDVILTGEMKDIMNQVLIAEKKAQANSIMRREETASTRSMLNTAKMMEENATLWKLKEMEYMEKIADKIGDITISGNSNIVSQLKEIFAK